MKTRRHVMGQHQFVCVAAAAVFTCHDCQHDSSVLNRTCQGTNAIQRRPIGYQAIPRYTTVCGFEANNATKARWLPYAATCSASILAGHAATTY